MGRDIKFIGEDLIKLLEDKFTAKAVDLGTKIQHQMVYSIQSEVYDVYTPRAYKRKKINGGLQDVKNMPLSVSSLSGRTGMMLEVGSRRKDEKSGRDVSALVEGGDGTNGMKYYARTGEKAKKPRKFMKSTYTIMRKPVGDYLKKMVKEVISEMNTR